MAPDVAQRDAVLRAAGQPDRREPVEQRAQDRRRGDRRLRVAGGQRVEQPAWPRGVAERLALRGQRGAQPAQQRGAALEADQRVVGIRLEQRRERIGVDRRERRGVDAQRVVAPRGKRAIHESAKARHAQPFGAGEALSRRRLVVMPGGTRAGVEQHADHRQVELRPRARGGAASGKRLVEFGATIDAARLEMPPAAVIGNGQRRIAAPRDRGNAVRRAREPVAMDGKVIRTAGARRGRNIGAAFADCRRRPQRRDRRGGQRRRHRPRPLVSAS